jgi:class 3 adenylate cyclase
MPSRKHGALATVMFTDIVSSSAIAEGLGDARWRVLLGRHNQIVRRSLAQHGGRELDTAGDGFFAAFDDPVAAVRCAAAIVQAVQDLGLEVRVGLHFGRIEQIGRKPGGVVVHIGARVMGLAGPAEVLLTGTLHDLIPGGGFRFDDRGRHELKGVSEGSQIYHLTEVDRRPLPEPLPPEEASSRRERIEPPPFLRRRRVPLAVAAAVALVAASLAIYAANRGSGPASPQHHQPPAHALVKIDPATMRVEATIAIGHPLTGINAPRGQESFGARDIAVGSEGSVWVTNGDDSTIARIDPVTDEQTTIPIPGAPRSLGLGPGAVWVTVDGQPVVYRIDPATNKVTASVDLGSLGVAVAVDRTTGVAWVLTIFDVERIDPSTNAVVATIPIPGLNTDINVSALPYVNLRMAVDGGSVWVPIPNGNLFRIEESTSSIDEMRHPAERLAEVAVDAQNDVAWVTATQQGVSIGQSIELSASTATVEDRFGVGCCPGSIAFSDGVFWVTDVRNSTLTAIVEASGTVGTPVHVGTRPTSVAAGGGAVWLTIDASSR